MRSIHDIDLKDLIQNKTYFPSPEAWENQVLYFLLVDRFSNDNKEASTPAYASHADYENALRYENTCKEWEEYGDKWNGGTLLGIKRRIPYLKKLGITAIWISPVFKQVAFEETYHGYGIQNFLAIDPHFGAPNDMVELIQEAHNNNMYVILDIVLNHTGNVFRYEEEAPKYNGNELPVKAFNDRDGQAVISPDNIDIDGIWPDGGVWPLELMALSAFFHKGQIVNWDSFPEYIEGDFFSLKKVRTGSGDYDDFQPSDALQILIDCYKYWIAFADVDGFRLDTVKHLGTGTVQHFVREIHEFAKTIGKNNFYIIGEITGGFEFAIDTLKKTGIDAALGINKIPEKLESVAKGYLDPIEFFRLFKNSELLGEEEHKWYKDNVVTMFDDHDMVIQNGQKARFCADKQTSQLLLNALFLNLMSPGIPCIYYGTEQGFDGRGEGDKYVREAMFGGKFGAFRTSGVHFFRDENPIYTELSRMIDFRQDNLTIRQGRVYQREISYNKHDFELPHKLGKERHTGAIVWSRILSDSEIVLAINCDLEHDIEIDAIIDGTLHNTGSEFECVYCSEIAMEGTFVEVVDIEGKAALHLTIPRHGCVAYCKKKLV
ncbi:MAG: alpha-amylase [Candidatus Hydrogenedentes bacterium]|nr:alpha-amylase [Candidatus Hydrogenedentota bacterium]